MANGTTSIKPNANKKILMHRMYTENADLSDTLYTVGRNFGLGIKNNTPSATDTDLTYPIPIHDGTICDDGSNNLTGTSGADTSTDNTSTFKQGAGAFDATSQNLIGNGTNVWAGWYRTLTSFADIAQYTGLWFYIKDDATFGKLRSTGGYAVKIYLGSDSSNFYFLEKNRDELQVGWNWLTVTDVLSTWDTTGTPTGDIDWFQIGVQKHTATDTFAAGDVVYDLLRQWEESDLYSSFVLGYPTIDYTNFESVTRTIVQATDANGFDIDSLIIMNSDTDKLPTNIAKFPDESKSINDQFIFMIKDRNI